MRGENPSEGETVMVDRIRNAKHVTGAVLSDDSSLPVTSASIPHRLINPLVAATESDRTGTAGTRFPRRF